jgi:hypothetical protein
MDTKKRQNVPQKNDQWGSKEGGREEGGRVGGREGLPLEEVDDFVDDLAVRFGRFHFIGLSQHPVHTLPPQRLPERKGREGGREGGRARS